MSSPVQSPRISENMNLPNEPLDFLHPPDDARIPIIEPEFKPWRVFINQLDSYHGKMLATVLPQLVYSDSRKKDLAEDDDDETEKDEDEDDEEYDRDAEESEGRTEASRKYEVIGTLSDPEYRVPEDITMIINNPEDRDGLLTELLRCGVVIYDISLDPKQIEEARWAIEAIVEELMNLHEKAPKAFKRNKERRHFILISTIMTWALSKPLSPDDPDLPLTEADYRKRRPHPNFKDHIQLEKEVVIVKKLRELRRKLRTLVICCGVTYGDGEANLHHLFKMAWLNAQHLPIIGRGNNKIPLLHVRDLVSTVLDVLREWPSLKYIVAVEQGLTMQRTIVKKISEELSNGKVMNIKQEEAFLYPEITQEIYDLMTVNLNVAPSYILDRLSWHLETPFAENIRDIVKEYKVARDLKPLKVIVLGPPASGKTKVARYLANHYRIHYIQVKSLIADTIQKLSAEIEAATLRKEEMQKKEESRAEEIEGQEEESEEEYDKEDEEAKLEEMQEELNEIRNNLSENNGRLNDVILNKLFQKRLWSKDCQNQGYVLDGYPRTFSQARNLFERETEDDEEELEEEEDLEDTLDGEEEENLDDRNLWPKIDFRASILPTLVVSLEASDEFLKERMINRPEKEIQNTHYTEKHMMRRLKEFRDRNTDDNTPVRYFDEMEIHPLIISVEKDGCPDMFPTISCCLQKLGAPKIYAWTAEEIAEAEKCAEAEKKAAEEAARMKEEREIEELRKERERKMMEWTELLEKLKEEEEARLCAMGEPLRHYLVRYVFPTLTQGLIEVSKVRPEDPIDFLAEYLFKENPEGKMFSPDYTETMSTLLDAIEKLQEHILPKEEIDEGTVKHLKDETVEMAKDKADSYDSHDVCANITSTTASITKQSSASDGFHDEEEFEFDDRSKLDE